MVGSNMKRNTVKALTDKTLGKSPRGDKSIEIDPDILFYELEDGDNTEGGKYAEILIIQYKNHAKIKQNLVKMNLPYINTFDHQGSTVVCVMCDRTNRVFENL